MPAVLTRAERQQLTRERVVDAAERLFVERGFHATSVDQIAREAGHTKGAVYSNFESKEDLFFAVYERRAERGIADMEQVIEAAGGGGPALEAVVLDVIRRRGRDDRWLSVFFEFWAHAIRRPALRRRFAQIHGRVHEPVIRAVEHHVRETGARTADDPRRMAVAMYAMQLGLSLERLTLPELVDEQLAARVSRALFERLLGDGQPAEGKDG